VYAVSWLAFVVTLFRDVRFTLHFMECEIGDLPPEEAREYLLGKQREYTRRLSYGSVPVKEQKRIDKTFEYLFAKYPAPAEEPLPDPAAERHEQVMGSVAEVKTAIDAAVTTTDRMIRESAEHHEQVIGGIAEVKTVIDGVAGYTHRKDREDTERREREAEQFAAAEKRRERHLSKSGFEPHPEDFSPKLSDAQFTLLAKYMNEIGVFQRDVTTDEVVRLFLCEHTEPLRTTHNKVIALLLERLSGEGLITPKWQRVAEHHRCFTSKMCKPLTAELIPEKKYEKIIAAVDAVVKSR